MLVIAGSVIKNVCMVALSVRFPLKKKSTREMRRLLIMVIWGPICIEEYCERMMPTQDSRMIIMSKIRH
jgi:hypothetical protein